LEADFAELQVTGDCCQLLWGVPVDALAVSTISPLALVPHPVASIIGAGGVGIGEFSLIVC
jgi:hypothetical protein